MKLKAPIVAVLLLAAGVAVVAQINTSTALMAPMPSGPPSQLRQLDYFKGSWSCQGKAFATPWQKEHAVTGAATGTWTLGSYWMQITYTEAKSAANAMPADVKLLQSWDGGAKHFVAGTFDSTGAYGMAQSDGWKGDKIVWAGPMHSGAQTMNVHDTFTKKNESTLIHTGEYESGGKWMKIDEQTCTRK